MPRRWRSGAQASSRSPTSISTIWPPRDFPRHAPRTTSSTRRLIPRYSSLPLARDELRPKGLARAGNRGHVWRAEMRRKQQRALLGAMIKHSGARHARLLGQLAEPGIPMRRVHLQRVMHNVAAEQAAVTLMREL